jgi:hypothetical protein
MQLKKVYLYDLANDPLRVKGIRIELHDAMKRKLIDHDISRDLNPSGNVASDTWGVELNFPSGKSPLDILVIDPTYIYPGNTLRYLNGDLSDEIYMDLFQLPSGPGGADPPKEANPPAINTWIAESPQWNDFAKEAVRGLIFNYAAIIGPVSDRLTEYEDLTRVATNWEAAARHVGIPEKILSPSSSLSKRQQRAEPKAAAGAS